MKDEPVVFAKFGRIEISRLDKYNWVVTGDGRTRYYPTLPGAIRAAAMVEADSKARNSQEWLREYAKVKVDIDRLVAQVVQNQQNTTTGGKKAVKAKASKS